MIAVRRTSSLVARAACWLLPTLLMGCGGGGGGGGAPSPGGPPPAVSVAFTGFSFRSALGSSTTPPLEDPAASPPTLGAPLDLVVVFHFDGVPAGPFDGSTLPVFTTPAEATPLAQVPAGFATLPAQGEHVLVVDPGSSLYTVEFRPSVPSAPLQLGAGAPPEAVPGLLPGSRYTALVSTTPGASLPNLQGPGGWVQFETTANPAAYYPSGVTDDDPPALLLADDTGALLSTPADGSGDFFPGVFASTHLATGAELFPPGPEAFTLRYDRRLAPTTHNLLGHDLDDDGLLDATFFLSTRATGLLLAHTLPAGALGGAHQAFPALSVLDDRTGAAPAWDGSDVFLHGSPDGALPDADPGFDRTPSSLALGADPSLLFLLLPGSGGGHARLAVVDHVLGDPRHARMGTTDGPPSSLDTGLPELTGLASLLDGRLVAFDAQAGRIVELLPDVTRDRPDVDDPEAGAPLLVGLALGDGQTGFLGAPVFDGAVFPDATLLDLAQAPSGRLLALARLTIGAAPVLLRLAPIDLDGNGQVEPHDGTFSGAPDDVLLVLAPGVVDLALLSERRLLALDREHDRVDLYDIDAGRLGTAVPDVAAFGLPFPAGQSPATALALGHMQLDLHVELQSNDADGALVRLDPMSLLPFDQELVVMQRNTLASLFGTSAVNADATQPAAPLGAIERLRVRTAQPLDQGAPFVDDTFVEAFDDDAREDPSIASTAPPAEWASGQPQGGTSGGLRASVGVSDASPLGDFRPQPEPGFDPGQLVYKQLLDDGEPVLDTASAGLHVVLLDTDAQAFPLADGSTPGSSTQTTVYGGHFAFHDVIVPAGVHVVVRGSNPLRITATGRVEIDGLIDLCGTSAPSDDTFNSGFLPVPGGAGGPGGGRGGDGHPTRFAPGGTHAIDQYVTPERGERGLGPVLDAFGGLSFAPVGGHGGISTLGYEPAGNGLPKLDEATNREYHRPPGGGGGSFLFRGDTSHVGTGSYRVQGESTWFPFDKCPLDDKIHDALYGNGESIASGVPGATPIQCVWMQGTPADPVRFQPGAEPGELVFRDDDPTNDFIGPGGELPAVIGGQGGGGGGSRIDSMRHKLWSISSQGDPLPAPPAPPYYPLLWTGIYLSPTVFDAKGGGGGGGGGAFHLRAFGDVRIGATGQIIAHGGNGGGSEVASNTSSPGGGGGGSGGAVIIEAAGAIRLQGEPGHTLAGFTDLDGDGGAAIDVSGGFGRDAKTDPAGGTTFAGLTFEATRSDGGQGGFGLVQLQSGTDESLLIEQGAFVFARKRSIEKRGIWNGVKVDQGPHPSWDMGVGTPPVDELRYIDVLHWRKHDVAGSGGATSRAYVLNGSFPPVIPSTSGDNGSGSVHEWPAGSGQLWWDTAMMSSPFTQDRWVVRDPHPASVMKTYLGWDPVTFAEPFFQQAAPGEPFGPDDVIPYPVAVAEPGGTFLTTEVEGVEVADPAFLVDRLPLVHPSRLPNLLANTSRGQSTWLDFAGVALRPRDGFGRAPPFFSPLHGTFNTAMGNVPAGEQGVVRRGAPVPGAPAHYVLGAGLDDPGLFGGGPGSTPFNDIAVDAPDPGLGLTDVVTDNAAVRLVFQGA